MPKTPYIDRELCISCGFCVSICSGVFRFGNDAKSETYNPAGANEKKIQEAIDGCPTQCISWQE